MLPRFSPRCAFVLKWPIIDASFGAIDALADAGFAAATYQDDAEGGFSMFFPGVAVIRTTPAAQAASVSERNE